MSNIRGKR